MISNIFLSVLEISASASLIILSLILLAPILNKRYAVKWKYRVWIVLALRLLIPFNGNISNHQIIVDIPAQMTAPFINQNADVIPFTPNGGQAAPATLGGEGASPTKAQPENSHTGITPLDIAAMIWLMGSLTVFFVHLFSYLYYCRRKLAKGGTYVRESSILHQLQGVSDELHIKGKLAVMEYSDAAGPMVIGFLRPTLVLPKEQYSEEELYFILKHELVHLKRHDIYFKLLLVAVNAVHWFNPLVWIMQKEATVDMELSCDERVVQGADFTARKAYTETLFSTLHIQCAGKTVLSTQFYGGANIMKKRFKNILMRTKKKNGLLLLVCTIVLTLGLGTMAGCSFTRSISNVPDSEAADSTPAGQEETRNTQEADALQGSEIPSVPEETLQKDSEEQRKILTLYMEGMPEEMDAALYAGEGYCIYIPDEYLQLSSPNTWTGVSWDVVQLWVTRYENSALAETEEALTAEGYQTEGSEMSRQEDSMVYRARLYENANDTWGVFYCYPVEAQEGWGLRLPVIADTFAVAADTSTQLREQTMRELLSEWEQERQPESDDDLLKIVNEMKDLSEDALEIKSIVQALAAAYFSGDTDAVKAYLTEPYEWDIDVYEGISSDKGAGEVNITELKGLNSISEKQVGDSCTVSVEFSDTKYDTLAYLTVELIKQPDGWKVCFYGLEG